MIQFGLKLLAGVAILSGIGCSSTHANSIFDPAPQQQNWFGGNNAANANSEYAEPIRKELVAYDGPYGANTIVVNTKERRLYLVMPNGKAMKYGVGVGRPGFQWGGVKHVTRKAEWPDWRPPAQMIKRRPDLPRFMPGGENNPLGARAMYLGSTLYRIHGSNEPESIGQAVSSGCFRMTNEDVEDLYERVRVGTRVVVQR